ncbi:MAG: hypothetical protein COA52_06085 [Hyphomicrobiales bacterium]|nr:MAG: hypothetical protein COA52_06085 [Hyphomicrobiales bacterium]
MRTHPYPITPFQRFFYIWMPPLIAIAVLALAMASTDLYKVFAADEVGLLETIHIIIPLVGFVIAVRLFFIYRKAGNRTGMALIGFAALVCLYIGGEEASYGQHFFGWKAQGLVLELNDQQETNLHNMSYWFDQKPRLVLELAIIFGGLLLPIFPDFFKKYVPKGLWLYAPTTLFLPTSVLMVLVRLPERLNFEGAALFPSIIRYSELQEVYLYLFITLYLYFVLIIERHHRG